MENRMDRPGHAAGKAEGTLRKIWKASVVEDGLIRLMRAAIAGENTC
jgi:hypothetical protein